MLESNGFICIPCQEFYAELAPWDAQPRFCLFCGGRLVAGKQVVTPDYMSLQGKLVIGNQLPEFAAQATDSGAGRVVEVLADGTCKIEIGGN